MPTELSDDSLSPSTSGTRLRTAFTTFRAFLDGGADALFSDAGDRPRFFLRGGDLPGLRSRARFAFLDTTVSPGRRLFARPHQKR